MNPLCNSTLLGVFLSFAAVSGQRVNTLCLIQHCQSVTSACVLDAGCKEALSCIHQCGADDDCCLRCLNSYTNTKLDAFLQCAVTVNHCIDLSPSHPFQCQNPRNVLTNFTLSDLQGSWYVVRGYNPAIDCFNCHSCQYSAGTSANTAQLTETYDVTTISGTVNKITSDVSVSQPNLSTGMLNFARTQDGLIRKDAYRVLAYSASQGYALLYYCGNIAELSFEGLSVYSRTTTLTPTALSEVTSAAKSSGYNVSTFCSPSTSGCA